MARYRIPGKHYTKRSILGITLLVVAVAALVAACVAAAVLPTMVEGHEGSDLAAGTYVRPTVQAIVVENEGRISINADLTQVFATVQYSDGTSEQVALSEMIVEGLDLSQVQKLDNVILDYGGFKQTVSYEVVPTTLTVTYLASYGGRIEGDSEQSVVAGGDATTVNAVPAEGYKFLRWSDGYPYASRRDKEISRTMTITAVFTKQTFTVIFYYPDGTTAREETVFYGSQPTNVPRADESNMQLYGYKFTGWDTNYTNVTEDLNIRPIMVKDAVDLEVEFTSDGSGPLGYIEDLEPYYPKGQQSVLRVRANDSRIFTGWEILNFDGEWVEVAPEGVSQQIELADGSFVMFTSARTGTSEEYTLSFTLPSDSYSTTAGIIYSMKMRADFVYKESVISFASNGAPVSNLPSVILQYGDPIGGVFDVEDLSVIALGGFTFGGWYYETEPDGTPVVLTNDAIIERDVTLTAHWIRNVYTVVFKLDGVENFNDFTTLPGYDAEAGGIVLTAEYQTAVAGALTGEFPAVTPEKTDYVFDGWFVSDMGEATSVAVTREYTVSGNVDVIPVFSVITKDFSVSLKGAGAVYVISDAGMATSPVQGVVKVPVNEDFRYAVVPSAGYIVTSVRLNGEVVAEGDVQLSDNRYVGTIEVNTIVTASQLKLEVDFELVSYSVNVANGSTGLAGTVEYYVSGTSGDGSWTTNASSAFTVSVPSGGSLVMRITAPEGNFVSSLSVNALAETLPADAETYTFTVADVIANTSVEIGYRGLYYTVTLPESVENAAIEGPTETSWQKGTDPGNYIVTADTGYYISAIRVNGTVLDPYVYFSSQISGGCHIVGFRVNDEEVSEYFGSGDYRITRVEFYIDSISRNTEIEIETAQLYYRINTSYYGGEGSVTESFVVGYGDIAEVVAKTDNTYSVASVEVNGEVENYPPRLNSVTYTTPEVKRDYYIVFSFIRALQTVTFTTNDTDMKLSYNGSDVFVGAMTSVADIPRGSSPVFVVTAPEDATLDSITVYTAAGTSYPEVIGYGVTSHTMTFDAIESDYTVEIAFSEVSYYVTAVVEDGNNSAVTLFGSTVMGDELLQETAPYRAAYNGSATININIVATRTLTIDDVSVVNVSGGDYYYVASSTGISGADYGAYTLENVSGGVITVSVYGIRSDVRVFLNFRDNNASDGTVKFGSMGSGALSASGGGAELTSGSALAVGTEIRFEAEAYAGAVLEGYLVNGQFTQASETLDYTVGEGLNSVYALFGEVRRYINVNLSSGSGTVNSDAVYVSDGEGFSVRFIPAAGYSLGSFYVSYGSTSRRDPGTTEIETYPGGVVQWNFPAGTVYDGDVTVHAAFTANNYTLSISYSSGGTVGGSEQGSNYVYSSAVSMNIEANPGYYISSVTVGGLSYAPSQLSGAQLDSSTNCFVSGTLNFKITGDTLVRIEFSPNAYTLIISDTLGGVTYVMTDAENGSGYENTDSVTFGAEENLRLRLNAEEGYHIAEIIVNGVSIWDWQISGVAENEMTEIYYDLGRRSSSLSVRVVYEINKYYIDVNGFNSSPNFASRDTDPSTYGTVSVTGYVSDADGIYTGISHGSDIRVVVTPRSTRGYYVESVVIYYVEPGGKEGIITLSREQMPVTGGAYLIENVSFDITSLSVEFKRYQYSFDISESDININLEYQPSGLYAFNGAVTVTFYNPYDRNAEVIIENGMYEYGLNYTLTADPGAGYERTGLIINGEDRMSSVRNNAVSGAVTSNVVAKAAFEIKRHTVAFALQTTGGAMGSIMLEGDMDDGSVFVWAPEYALSGVYVLNSGIIWAEYDGKETALTVTYGTSLRFIATPDFDSSGSIIESFSIFTDSALQRVTVEDATLAKSETHAIAGETYAVASFAVKSYYFTVISAEGGNPSVSSATVKWGENFKFGYELYTGYEVDGYDEDDVFIVSVDGTVLPTNELNAIRAALFAEGEKRTYTFENVRADYVITISPARRKYSATFTGGYAQRHSDTVFAVAELSISGGRSFSSLDLGAGLPPEAWKPSGGIGADYDGMRFNDRVTVKLTPAEGYNLVAATVIMGEAVYTVVDFVYGNGYYTLTIDAVKANFEVNVKYELRTYEVAFASASGGTVDGIEFVEGGGNWVSGEKIGHHSVIRIGFTAYTGYYLSSLAINGISYTIGYNKGAYQYNVIPTKTNDGIYVYTATFTVNDAFVNAMPVISIEAGFSPQAFALSLVINRKEFANGSGDASIRVSSEYGSVEYNTKGGTPILHSFTTGYEIKSLTLYNNANWSVDVSGASRIGTLTGVAYGAMTGKNQYEKRPDADYNNLDLTMYLDISLDFGGKALFSYLDIHDPDLSTLYMVYETELSKYSVNFVDNSLAYMVADGTEYKFTSEGSANGSYFVNGVSVATYSISFSDDSTSLTGHTHGSLATFNVQLSDAVNYVFEGFQEYRNGTWSYVRNGINGITVAANGLEMRYTMTSTRTFRAVFYHIYTVTVEIMPNYKYISGNFSSANPDSMVYQIYASITALASYDAQGNPDRILPDIAANKDGVITETLENGGARGGAAVFRIRSGAVFTPFGADTVSSVNRANIAFYTTRLFNTLPIQTLNVVSDTTLYAGDPSMAVYLSFLSETYGASNSNAGGSLNVSLSSNSYRVSAGSAVTIAITPNSGYRIESVGYLLDTGTPDSNGNRRFTTTYKTFTPGTGEENFALSAAEANGVVRLNVTVTENMIIKIRYVKQVTVVRTVALFENKTVKPGFATASVFEDNTWVDNTRVFDYGTQVNFKVVEGLANAANVNVGYDTRYRFMGYMINGVMQYNDLTRGYPGSAESSFVLDDLGGKLNGATITNVSTSGGTEFRLEVVAVYQPVYTIVAENIYRYQDDSGEWRYEPAGEIVATTTLYNSERPQYYSSSTRVESYLGGDPTKQTIQVMEQLNGITGAAYNTWSDNTITLEWSGTGKEEGFELVGWQYWYYRGEQYGGWNWGLIPDATGSTYNAAKNNYTFPVSALYDESYLRMVSTDNSILGDDENYLAFTCSDSGDYVYGDIGSYCIVIRPLFQQKNVLELIPSVAMQEPGNYIDGEGDQSPRIEGTAYPSASFNAGTMQTALPNTFDDYIFDGWWVSADGERVMLEKTGTWLSIQVDGSERELQYKYNPDDDSLNVIMNDSYTIYPRYTRKYTMNIAVNSLSGTAASLIEALPKMQIAFIEGEKETEITDFDGKQLLNYTMPVGSKLVITLPLGKDKDKDDWTDERGRIDLFNPTYDRVAGISILDNNGNELFGQNSDYDDAADSEFASDYFSQRLSATALSSDDFADYIDKINAIKLVITANTSKRININFLSYGELIIHNLYCSKTGSGIKLPADFAIALGADEAAASDYWIYDGDEMDSDGKVNGEISIINIPISPDIQYDKQSSSDFWVRIKQSEDVKLTLDTSSYISKLNFNLNGNDTATEYFVKIQHVFFYDDPDSYNHTYSGYLYERNPETGVTGFNKYDAIPYSEGVIKEGYPFKGGIGTKGDPFLISTAFQMDSLNSIHRGMEGNLSQVYFKLNNDIDLSSDFSGLIGADFKVGKQTYSNGFIGHLDGNGKTLKNVRVTYGANYVGIFSKLGEGSSVTNLTINGIVTGASYVGMLAGELYGGTINQVRVTALPNTNVSTVQGENYVGGIVGYMRGTTSINAVVEDCSVSNAMVVSIRGGTLDDKSNSYTGGAGGIAGAVAANAYISGSVNEAADGRVTGTSEVTNVTVLSPLLSGQVAGSLEDYEQEQSTDYNKGISGVIAYSVNYDFTDNLLGVGGIVGSVGQNRYVENVYYVVNSDTKIYSIQASGTYSGYKAPDKGSVYKLGIGIITARNIGKISSAHVITANDTPRTVTLTGAFIGGIAGVNFGIIEASSVTNVKLYSDRSVGLLTSIGGIAGVNWGTGKIVNSYFELSSSELVTGVRERSAIELTTGGNTIYDPIANYSGSVGLNGGLNNIYEVITAADSANVYIGLAAGYNSGSITSDKNVSYSGNLLLNRRSSDTATGQTYVGGLVGYNYFSGTWSGIDSVTTDITVFHYMYVDAGTRDAIEPPQKLYVGRMFGGGTRFTGEGSGIALNGSVNVTYLGAGQIYNGVSNDHIFSGHEYGSGAQEGAATVYCSEGTGLVQVNQLMSSSPNGEFGINRIKGDGKWITDFITVQGGGWGGNEWITSATNYNGYVRYIAVSKVNL